MNKNYKDVADVAKQFICEVALPTVPNSNLDSILSDLRSRLDALASTYAKRLDALVLDDFSGRQNLGSTGLNTVGMLGDRLTILLIKEWCLGNRGAKSESAATALRDNQINDIIAALNSARPGSASTHAKITHLKGGANASTWGEAFIGLLSANILLWESQEILYIHDIGKLPAESLRQYISWFAVGNMRRNEYIQLLEGFFWANVNK